MSFSIAVICEYKADRDTVAALVDRLILEQHRHSDGWIDEEGIEQHRSYRGFRPTDEFVVWSRIGDLFNSVGARPIRPPVMNGYFPEHGDEVNILRARNVLLIHSPLPPDGLIFLRDTDNEVGRKQGLENANQHIHEANSPVVVGVAHTKRECWHIAGFEPDSADEPTEAAELFRIDELRRGDNLGFDPRHRSEELTATGDGDKRSAKRVLNHLTNANQERERRCLQHLAIPELEQRGQNNGLTAFLRDVKQRILPIFGSLPS